MKRKTEFIPLKNTDCKVVLPDGTTFTLELRGRFYTARFTADKRQKRLATKRTTWKDAAAVAGPKVKAAQLGKWAEVERVAGRNTYATLTSILDAYVNDPNAESARPTRKRGANTLRLVLREAGLDPATARADVLTARLLLDLKARRVEGLAGKKLESAKRTVNSCYCMTKAIFKPDLLADPDANPYRELNLPDLTGFRGVPPFKRVGVSVDIESVDKWAKKVLMNIGDLKESDPGAFLAIKLAAYCGLRLGEVINARKSWIDEKTIRIQSTEDWQTKSRRPRTVPLPEHLRQDILLLSDDSDFIIPPDRRRVGYRVSEFVHGLLINGQDWPFKKCLHTLRVWAGSQVVTLTQSLPLAQEFLGHSSVVITERYYARLISKPEFEIPVFAAAMNE